MEDKIAAEVQAALTEAPEAIRFETLQDEDASPLNQPVVEKDIGGERSGLTEGEQNQAHWNVWKPEQGAKTTKPLESAQTDYRRVVEAHVENEKAQEPLDAPEQAIHGDGLDGEAEAILTREDFEMPLSGANQAADALLGMTNTMMAVGGGYFVKIRKHKEFYEFEEILQVIDTQNEKNIERLKLDQEDQALLRPLLAQVLRKKSKQLTPEQQFMGAVVSILMKKAQVVMEVRAENSLLEARILDIIREEKGPSELTDENEIEEPEDELQEVAFTQTKAGNESQSKQKSVKAVAPEPMIQDIEIEEVDASIPILELADETEHTQS